MAIKSSGGPADGAERVGRALSALASPVDRLMRLELEAAPGGLAAQAPLSAPLPVYGADLDSLQGLADRKAGFETLPRTGWRYLVLDETDVQAADLDAAEAGPVFHVGGDLAARIASAGKLAEERAEDQVEYEPRLLDLGMLDATLLWLRGDTPGTDLFFTLDDEPRQIGEGQLLRQVASAARRKLRAFDDSADGDDDDTNEAGG